MAILLDVYLGVPVIYSTFMQYDELAHHFGPSSKQALSDLRRTDAQHLGDLAHGASGRRKAVRSGDSLRPWDDAGRELSRAVRRVAWERPSRRCSTAMCSSSHSEASEYADIGSEVIEAVAV